MYDGTSFWYRDNFLDFLSFVPQLIFCLSKAEILFVECNILKQYFRNNVHLDSISDITLVLKHYEKLKHTPWKDRYTYQDYSDMPEYMFSLLHN